MGGARDSPTATITFRQTTSASVERKSRTECEAKVYFEVAQSAKGAKSRRNETPINGLGHASIASGKKPILRSGASNCLAARLALAAGRGTTACRKGGRTATVTAIRRPKATARGKTTASARHKVSGSTRAVDGPTFEVREGRVSGTAGDRRRRSCKVGVVPGLTGEKADCPILSKGSELEEPFFFFG